MVEIPRNKAEAAFPPAETSAFSSGDITAGFPGRQGGVGWHFSGDAFLLEEPLVLNPPTSQGAASQCSFLHCNL